MGFFEDLAWALSDRPRAVASPLVPKQVPKSIPEERFPKGTVVAYTSPEGVSMIGIVVRAGSQHRTVRPLGMQWGHRFVRVSGGRIERLSCAVLARAQADLVLERER